MDLDGEDEASVDEGHSEFHGLLQQLATHSEDFCSLLEGLLAEKEFPVCKECVEDNWGEVFLSELRPSSNQPTVDERDHDKGKS